MTATLLTETRLSQYGFVGRDRLPRRTVPAELPRLLQPRPPPPIRVADHRGCRIAESLPVAVLDEHPRVVDNLRDARIPKRRHGAAAGHGLEAREAESFVAARKQQAARRRIQVSQLLIVHPTQLDGARHAGWGLTARSPGNQELQVGMDDASGRPRVQQGMGILPGVEGTDEEQVASLDSPLVLHPL